MQYWVSINDLLARYTIVTSWPSYSLGYLLQIILRAYCIIIRACVSVRSGAQRWCRNYRLQFSRMVPGRPWLYICRVEFSSCRVFFFFFLCRVFFFFFFCRVFFFFFLLPLLSSFSSSSCLCDWTLTTWVKWIPRKQIISDYTKTEWMSTILPHKAKRRDSSNLTTYWPFISHDSAFVRFLFFCLRWDWECSWLNIKVLWLPAHYQSM